MKIGIVFANLAYRTPDSLEAMATAAEEAGVESVWAEEHPAIPAHPEIPTVTDDDPTGDDCGGRMLQAVPFPDSMVHSIRDVASRPGCRASTVALSATGPRTRSPAPLRYGWPPPPISLPHWSPGPTAPISTRSCSTATSSLQPAGVTRTERKGT